MTLLTLPVAFSSTRMSFVPMKAMLVGWLRPKATLRTARFGSTTDGATSGSWAIAGRTHPRVRIAAMTPAWNAFRPDLGTAAGVTFSVPDTATLVFARMLRIRPPLHGPGPHHE